MNPVYVSFIGMAISASVALFSLFVNYKFIKKNREEDKLKADHDKDIKRHDNDIKEIKDNMNCIEQKYFDLEKEYELYKYTVLKEQKDVDSKQATDCEKYRAEFWKAINQIQKDILGCMQRDECKDVHKTINNEIKEIVRELSEIGISFSSINMTLDQMKNYVNATNGLLHKYETRFKEIDNG